MCVDYQCPEYDRSVPDGSVPEFDLLRNTARSIGSAATSIKLPSIEPSLQLPDTIAAVSDGEALCRINRPLADVDRTGFVGRCGAATTFKDAALAAIWGPFASSRVAEQGTRRPQLL